ncbi:MAG TPA: M20/M25/M40 family metallo-hydrolase [Gaiellaceae bacterium]|nr:M20/M25/M40 family metallo-hydrolase [Gaiellaceae bacterium]
MALTPRERALVDAVASRRDDLVELASALVGFDTTARNVGDPPRDEAALQEQLGARLRAAGAEVEIWEPDTADLVGEPLVPEGLDFEGRPQLAARFRGSGEGRSLLLNGHIDAVSAEPRDRWTSDPHRGEVRDGRLYGRGSCDMKGGVAAMTVAAETLAAEGVRLAGDLVVCTNTDEESSGAGSTACARHGVRADGGIVLEPTGFNVWVACRGSSYTQITVPGRPGHAEIEQPHWRNGGAVNAIEKAALVLEGIRRLRERWRADDSLTHPYLSRPDVVPTLIHAGEWVVTYPAACRISGGALFLPQQADSGGFGSRVEREVEEAILDATAADDWLAENPPTFRWEAGVMSMSISEDDPIVAAVGAARDDVGRAGKLAGLDSWYDGATFTVFAGTPSVGFGPGGFETAHAIDEYVPVDDLVACAQAVALAALRFCGEAS